MQRSREVMHHEVRLRAAAWARRLIEQHGDDAEIIVRATLKRRELTAHERLAARFTRDALADLRRNAGYARTMSGRPDGRRGTALSSCLAWLFRSRRSAPNRLSHH